MDCHFIASHERPFNTENKAIYRFSISFLVPELQRFKDGQMRVICGAKKLARPAEFVTSYDKKASFMKI